MHIFRGKITRLSWEKMCKELWRNSEQWKFLNGMPCLLSILRESSCLLALWTGHTVDWCLFLPLLRAYLFVLTTFFLWGGGMFATLSSAYSSTLRKTVFYDGSIIAFIILMCWNLCQITISVKMQNWKWI